MACLLSLSLLPHHEWTRPLQLIGYRCVWFSLWSSVLCLLPIVMLTQCLHFITNEMNYMQFFWWIQTFLTFSWSYRNTFHSILIYCLKQHLRNKVTWCRHKFLMPIPNARCQSVCAVIFMVCVKYLTWFQHISLINVEYESLLWFVKKLLFKWLWSSSKYSH